MRQSHHRMRRAVCGHIIRFAQDLQHGKSACIIWAYCADPKSVRELSGSGLTDIALLSGKCKVTAWLLFRSGTKSEPSIIKSGDALLDKKISIAFGSGRQTSDNNAGPATSCKYPRLARRIIWMTFLLKQRPI